MKLPLTGGCNGGAVRYEVVEPLVRASYCHCKRCQRRSGSAEVRSGSVATCGSAMFGSNPGHPESIGIRMGTFDRDPGIRPSVRQFVAYAAAREALPDDGLPRFPESRHFTR
jgi:hypothetical protein